MLTSKVIEYTISDNTINFIGNYPIEQFFTITNNIKNTPKNILLNLTQDGRDIFICPKKFLFTFLNQSFGKVNKQTNSSNLKYFTINFIAKNKTIFTLNIKNNNQLDKFFTAYVQLVKKEYISIKKCANTRLNDFSNYNESFVTEFPFLNTDSFHNNLKEIFKFFIDQERKKNTNIIEELTYHKINTKNQLFSTSSGIITAYLTPEDVATLARGIQGKNSYNVYFYFLMCIYLIKNTDNILDPTTLLSEKKRFLNIISVMINDLKTKIEILKKYKEIFTVFNNFNMFDNYRETRTGDHIDFTSRDKLTIGYTLYDYISSYNEMFEKKTYMEIFNDIIQKKQKEMSLLNQLLIITDLLFNKVKKFFEETGVNGNFIEFIFNCFIENFSLKKNLTRCFMYVFLQEPFTGDCQEVYYKKAKKLQKSLLSKEINVIQIFHK